MPRPDYRRCRRCRRPREQVGELSHTRLCDACGGELLRENVLGLARHEGEAWERWRRAVTASLGGILVDDLESLVQTPD